MGFKDWGAWNLFAKSFTNLGFGFCKFNLTHNGGNSSNGIDFPDLDAFANNTYSKEKNDVKYLLDEIQNSGGTRSNPADSQNSVANFVRSTPNTNSQQPTVNLNATASESNRFDPFLE